MARSIIQSVKITNQAPSDYAQYLTKKLGTKLSRKVKFLNGVPTIDEVVTSKYDLIVCLFPDKPESQADADKIHEIMSVLGRDPWNIPHTAVKCMTLNNCCKPVKVPDSEGNVDEALYDYNTGDFDFEKAITTVKPNIIAHLEAVHLESFLPKTKVVTPQVGYAIHQALHGGSNE
ncbi:hypothetical protein GR7B_00221 [Vibrio phage vB_VcorM_GR7B]|nr:hypothetical protein GR7B_00221 [Vibrio phage vB_VcorM_GR7B]